MRRVSSLAALAAFLVYPGAARPAPIDATARHDAVEALAAGVSDVYVFADIGKQYADSLRARLAGGAYDAIADDAALADRLTTDLQAIHPDKHLRVLTATDPRGERFRPPGSRAGAPPGDPRASMLARERTVNFGFARVEILPGNVGLVDLRSFDPAEIAGETAVAAMRFLGNCDAVIFDLRKNGGGSPTMIQLLVSYLVGEDPEHINDFYIREGDETRQFHTLPYVPGTRLKDADVFVLTSRRTFSAAEEFTYDLQALKRGTVVGDTTGGGAHPVRPVPLAGGLIATVPFGRAINPVTGKDWEGTGVIPDLPCAADDALDVAHAEALRRLAEHAKDDARKTELAWALDDVNARLKPPSLEPRTLEQLTGSYGARAVALERGRLWLRPEVGPMLELSPLGKDVFAAMGAPSPLRVTFVRAKGGRASELVLTSPSGEIGRFARS
ncbi:MAG: S41 family peptidase [bacterium]